MPIFYKTLLTALLPVINQIIDAAQEQIDPDENWTDLIDGVQAQLNKLLLKLAE